VRVMRVIESGTEGATVEMTRRELWLVKNAILYVCYEESSPVEDWEFPTRMGGLEREEALIFGRRISALLKQDE
jgi:hypothetical protein